MAQDNKVLVVKRNLGKEDFSYDKLIASILKCGVPMEAAEKFSKEIESWARASSSNGEIDSASLRDKIIETISTDFPSEADSYQAYVKS